MKRILALLVVLSLILSSFSFNISAKKDEKTVTNISNNKNIELKTIKEDKENKDVKDCLLLDSDQLLDNTVFSYADDAYKNGKKVLILGNDINKNDIKEKFGVKGIRRNDSVKKSRIENQIEANDDEPENMEILDVSEFVQIGVLIYQDGNAENCTGLYVEEVTDEMINEIIDYSFNYDYIKMESNQGEALIEVSPNNSEASDWRRVGVDSSTFNSSRGQINTSMELKEDEDNPITYNQYVYHAVYRVDVDLDNPYHTNRLDVKATGANSSGNNTNILDYGPDNGTYSSGSGSITISLGRGIVDLTFDPSARSKFTRVGGGIDNYYVDVKQEPVNTFGLATFVADIHSEVHYVAYMPNDNFYNTGDFEVYSYKRNISGTFTNLIKIIGSDSVSKW